MRKNSLLKVLGIAFIIFVILSWIFPTGSFSGGEYVKDAITPIGIFDLGYYPLLSVYMFMQYGILFLTIGGLYGVLNKTGVYTKLVRLSAEKWENKKTMFMVLSIILISGFVSVTGLVIPVMAVLPYIYAVMYRLGYSKQSSAAATIGAIFAGVIGSTIGLHALYGNYILNLDLSLRTMAFRAVLYVLVTGLLILYVMKHSKKDLETTPAEDRYDVLLYNKGEETKKSLAPFVIISILAVLFIAVSMYPWTYLSDKLTIFEDIYEKIVSFTIKDFPIFSNILGQNITPFGYWLNFELATVFVFLSLIIGWLYGVKFEDIVKSFGEGCKKIFSVAFYACVANVILAVILNTNSNIAFTFIEYLSRIGESFSVPIASLMTGIGSFFYNDFTYLLSYVTYAVSSIYPDTTNFPLISIITQAIYGVVMLFAPVSVVLLAGLRIFDVNYKDWIKYMWKFILMIAAIVLVVTFIISAI